jgi:RNA polymerase sigma factor (sigma-70 family)
MEKENKTKFSKALQKLPLQQKEGLLLKFYQNKSYEEISEILGITTSSCRTLVYRALKSVRQGVYNVFL